MDESLLDCEVVELIESISGDEFCETLACDIFFMEDHERKLTRQYLMDMLKTASNKLSDIYTIAHSHNRQSSCYTVHDSWRKRALEQYDGLQH